MRNKIFYAWAYEESPITPIPAKQKSKRNPISTFPPSIGIGK